MPDNPFHQESLGPQEFNSVGSEQPSNPFEIPNEETFYDAMSDVRRSGGFDPKMSSVSLGLDDANFQSSNSRQNANAGIVSFNVDATESTPPPGANSATWPMAAYHTVTAVVGAGVLGLPYAFSRLGWAAGIFFLGLAAGVSLWTSYLMASMHEMNGVRINRYRDLGSAILGRKKALLFVAPFQFLVMIGSGIAYTLTAAQSLLAIEVLNESESRLTLTQWIFVFAILQVTLSQLPDFHSLWWISILGAAMSVIYSVIVTITSFTKSGGDNVDYGPRETGSDQVLAGLSAIGAIMFSYGGHSVLLEIQATLKAPPSPKESMMKGVNVAYLISAVAYYFVAGAGYGAFGNAVEPDVLLSLKDPGWLIAIAHIMVLIHVAASFQVYSMPVFEAVESKLCSRFEALERNQLVLRLVFRTLYVLAASFVAACLPFFGDLMGLIGAIGFTPMTFIMPTILWLIAKPDRPVWEKVVNWSIVIGFTMIGVLAFIGATAQIARHASEYEFLS